MKFQGFVGPTYQHRSLNVNAQRTVNLYPEAAGPGGDEMVLMGTPGLTTFTTLSSSPVRGLWAGSGVLYAAAGTKIYEVASNGTATEKGTIATDSDNSPVQMFPNGTQLLVIASNNVYLHDGTTLHRVGWAGNTGVVDVSGTGITWVSGDKFDASMATGTGRIVINGTAYTVSSVTDDENAVITPGGGTQTGVTYRSEAEAVLGGTGCFLDSYFVVAPQYGKRFYISRLNNGLEWDPLDYSTKEGYPDNVAAVLADHKELWLFGDQTTEVWRNTGRGDFPFEADPTAFIHQGIVAPWSAVNLISGPGWLGGDTRGRVVAYMAQGFQPIRVSTHAVESAWASYSRVSDAISYLYSEEGHTFWVITFPTGNATWAYDLTTKLWHERAWYDGAALRRHRGRCHAFIYDKHLIGDHTSGKIYQQSLATYDDDGTDIHRLRAAPYVGGAEGDERLFYSRFRLLLETGNLGEPTFTLEWSNDGGHNWTTPQVRTAGATDEREARVLWRRLGNGRRRAYRVQSTAAMRHAWIAAYLDAEKGSS